jgi:hypothetical protein
MKKYTEKQIETFKEMINNGIISQIDGNDSQMCRRIAKDIHDIEEGYYYFEELTTNEVVNEWDARGEQGDLIYKLIESFNNPTNIIKNIVKDYEEYLPTTEINRKSMIKLLGLRDYATKEDILKEIDELL